MRYLHGILKNDYRRSLKLSCHHLDYPPDRKFKEIHIYQNTNTTRIQKMLNIFYNNKHVLATVFFCEGSALGLSTDQFGRLSFCAGAGAIKGESTYQIGQIFQA